MNYLKRSIMAVAGVCLLSANADAYTKNLYAQHPTYPQYNITFKPSFLPYPLNDENEDSEGQCSICWHSNCWDFNYSYDGKKTFYIDGIGAITFYKDKIYTPFINVPFEVIK
jgi:hypothetical protein